MWHLISTYASISPSDIQEIIFIKKRLKINSDAVLKYTAVIFPWTAKKGEFPVFSFNLTDRFPRIPPHIHWFYRLISDLYITSSKDEWAPSALSLQPTLHPARRQQLWSLGSLETQISNSKQCRHNRSPAAYEITYKWDICLEYLIWKSKPMLKKKEQPGVEF